MVSMGQQEIVSGASNGKNEENRRCPVIYCVLPCFNEEEGLETTAEVLKKKVGALLGAGSINRKSRILFVDDGSLDATWTIIARLHASDPLLFGGIKLAHNRGHQNALLAGLMEALHDGCDAAISMDADLQDDVGVVDEFIRKYSFEECEVVYGVRSSRDTDTWFKRTTAGWFYKIFAWMGAETVPNHADYRLLGRQALQALSEYKEVNLFLRGIVPVIGFKSDKVYYKRGVRRAGVSKYPLKKMISFALQGITSFSVKPLQFVITLGLVSLVVGLVMLIYTLVAVFSGRAVAGWGSLMCSLWLIGGLLMLSLGIVGEYVGKIYLESKHRPRYFVEKKL